jgi:hypothetical protein
MIELFVYLAIGYVIGNVHTVWRVRKILQDEGFDVSAIPDEEETSKVVVRKLTIQEMDNMLYLYYRDTEDFICQANSMEELAKACSEYNKILVATVIHNTKTFIFANGNYQEFTG